MLCGVVFENVGGGGGWSAGHLGLCLGGGTDEGVVAQRTPKCARGICSCMAAFAYVLLSSLQSREKLRNECDVAWGLDVYLKPASACKNCCTAVCIRVDMW